MWPDRVLGKSALVMIFRLEAISEQTVRRYFLQVKKLTFKRAPGSHMPFCSTALPKKSRSWLVSIGVLKVIN
jgi:hypothetical protein